MGETFRKWQPVGAIEWPCAGVEISNAGTDLVLKLEFSAVTGGGDRDLILRFPWGRVVAFASWDEFAHPWNNETEIDSLPKLGGNWPNCTFPLLEVGQSSLLAKFGEGQRAAYPDVRHLRIVTLDHTLDVLATGEPLAEWKRAANKHLHPTPSRASVKRGE